ncbi:hypothetical protein [Nakamurella leprariae]|uniref:Uncharacterized protein n=1 Tax=Nakamurella leprariae TaxID=2803911 RepID=A0A938YEZ9_9ACTN|nr:hypothetical protein [Nakamurella leprariae]MBM9468373.1 hypothetical protein [Nakamurella leprariae]
MDLDEVADELYGLPLDEFTPTRTERERQAKSDGDQQLAGAIRRLTKPNVAAWLTNQLVRQHPDEIDPLLQLGAGLRDATAALSGDRLRTLAREQHRVVAALVQQARALARDAGQAVSEDTARAVQTTLQAALADEDAADAVRAARLTKPLEHTGFGGLSGLGDRGASGAATRSDRPGRTGTSDDFPDDSPDDSADDRAAARERDRAERELEQARQAVADATEQRSEARATARAATDAARDARDEVDRLEDALASARRDLTQREREQARTSSALDRAEQALAATQARVRELTSPGTPRSTSRRR